MRSYRRTEPSSPERGRGHLTVLLALILGVLLGLAGCRCASEPAEKPNEAETPRYVPGTVPVLLHGESGAARTLMLEVARTPRERARGLMYRRSIPEDGGMLFVFEEEGDWPFYMRNTYIPLDLIYVTGAGQVCGFIENMKPHDESPRSPGCSAQYVIEVRAGSVAAWSLREGDRVEIP